MMSIFSNLAPGLYQYVYPTFTDAPQQIWVHFLTPDGQQAFVSYPNHPYPKAAHLVSVSWFSSVKMRKLEGESQLMHFLQVTLIELLNSHRATVKREDSLPNDFEMTDSRTLLAA